MKAAHLGSRVFSLSGTLVYSAPCHVHTSSRATRNASVSQKHAARPEGYANIISKLLKHLIVLACQRRAAYV